MKNVKERKKGFTLIELLVTIAILSLVMVVAAFGILNLLDNSKKNALMITEKGIKEAASTYAHEGNFDGWQKVENVEEKHEYFCVTIGELINKGILKEDKIDKNKYPLNMYIAVLRNKETKTIEKEELVDDDVKEIIRKVCTGNSKESEKYIPNVDGENIFTDEIKIDIDYDDLKDKVLELDDEILEVRCLYGESSSKLNNKGEFIESEGRCDLDNLKSNHDYWVRVCIETNIVNSACTDTKEYTTKDLIKPVITLSDVINIKYDDENINGESYHYFKSTVSGSIDSDVYECDNSFNCMENVTRDIKTNTWYRTFLDEVDITVVDGTGKITARIVDKSDNYAENSKEFSINKIIFVKGNADKIDGQTSNVEKKCLAEKGSSCKIVSPTIEKVGYEPLGWNNDNSATESNWNIGVEKDVDKGITYYPILRQSPIYVYYHVNEGIITSSAGGYNWTTDSSGMIYRNNNASFYKVLSNTSTNSDGFVNYNNSSYINITKIGYIAKSGEEWNTKLDGSGTDFSQNAVYTYNDLINYATLDGNNYRLDLYVNWTPQTYTINYYLGNGTSTVGNTKIGSSTCTYGQNCSLKTWSELGASFPNSGNGWLFAGWSNTSSGTSRNYSDGQSFTYNTADNINLYAVGSRTFNFYSGLAPTSMLNSDVQYWNPYSTENSYRTSISVPEYLSISGWSFIGYRANNTASSTVTFSSSGSVNPEANYLTSFDFRSIYQRTLTLSFDENGGSGSMSNLTATQYYNSGYASSGSNSGSNVSIPSFTLPSSTFTPPINMMFSKWADGSANGTQYAEGTSYIFAPSVEDTAINKKMYAIWVVADDEDPTCTIDVTEGENDDELLLTVKGQDTMKLADLPYSWTEDDSGYDSYEPKTVSSVGTYTAYVRDAAGNKNHCSVKITNTSVSKYDKTTKTCGRTFKSVDCKGKFSSLFVCNSGSKCSGNTTTSGKCECYSRTTSTRFCSSSYPNYDSTQKQCYKLGWQYSTVVKSLSGTGVANDQTTANNFCASEWNNYTSGSGTSKIEYRNCSAYKSEISWDQYWDCQCDKYTYNKKTYTSYSCTSGNNLGDGYCYTYLSGSCPSDSYRGSSSNNGDPDYCYDEGRSSCGGGFTTLIRTNYKYAFTSETTSATSCSLGNVKDCDSDNYEYSYVSKCTPTAYSCSSGTKLNDTYCYE